MIASRIANGSRTTSPSDCYTAPSRAKARSNDVDNTSGVAGESAGLIQEIESVRQIVDDTSASFWREIDRLASLRR